MYILCMRMDLELSERLLLCRRDMSLTQLELSERSGVSRSYIAQVERGTVTNIGIEPLRMLANALGVKVGYLIGESDVAVDEEEDELVLAGAQPGYKADPTMRELLGLIEGMAPGQRQQMAGIARLLLGGSTIIE